METQSEQKIDFAIVCGDKTVEMPAVDLRIEGATLYLQKDKKTIILPAQNIVTIGKNQLKLYLFTHDPERAPYESWEGQQEDAQKENQGQKLDMILFSMLDQAVKTEKQFNNVLKGTYQLFFVFKEQEQLKQTQKKIEKALSELQLKNQVGIVQIEGEQQMYNDVE